MLDGSYFSPSSYLAKSENLAGLADIPTARGNLGLGTMATQSSTNYAALAGATFTGLVNTPASTITTAGLRLPHGTAPTTPVDGDIWTTTSGIQVRINGVTSSLAQLAGTNTFSGTSNSFSGTLFSAGTSTGNITVNIGNSGTLSGNAKNINIGTGGAAGSNTNINIGSAASTTAITFAAGARASFSHSSTTAGIRIAPVAGDPTSTAQGDIWYNSTTNALTARMFSSNMTLNAVKSWVNFNGTGTVAIRSSSNVTSITDNGVGDYTVNMSITLTDANYLVIPGPTPAINLSGTAGAWFAGLRTNATGNPVSKTTSAYRVGTAQLTGGTQIDVPEAYFAVIA